MKQKNLRALAQHPLIGGENQRQHEAQEHRLALGGLFHRRHITGNFREQNSRHRRDAGANPRQIRPYDLLARPLVLVVDEGGRRADLAYGVSFDWGTLCSTERSVIADYPIKAKLVEALKSR